MQGSDEQSDSLFSYVDLEDSGSRRPSATGDPGLGESGARDDLVATMHKLFGLRCLTIVRTEGPVNASGSTG
jgi:hypothetical protein